MTTGVSMGSRRSRRLEPSSQASSVVKCSRMRDLSIWRISSSCGVSESDYYCLRGCMNNLHLEAEPGFALLLVVET
jgi:hypothetical protein